MADPVVFVGVLVIAYVVPGPDMIMLLRTGAAEGRRRALAATLGLAMARGTHVALAALGLGQLLVTVPLAFDLVRFGGAAYLAWLGLAILRAPVFPADAGPRPDRLGSAAAAVRRGLLTNLLNPKPLLFCSVLLPQFIRPAEGAVAGQFLVLGIVLVAVGLAFDTAYAVGGAALGRWILRHPRVERLQSRVFGGALIGFGVQMAWAARPR